MPKMEVATTRHHGGTIGFARAKDALEAEGGRQRQARRSGTSR